MNVDPRQLISGYFDDTLNENEHVRLTEWINANPANARQFADASLLHDRLRDELVVQATLTPEEVSGRPKPRQLGRGGLVVPRQCFQESRPRWSSSRWSGAGWESRRPRPPRSN